MIYYLTVYYLQFIYNLAILSFSMRVFVETIDLMIIRFNSMLSSYKGQTRSCYAIND